MGVLSAALVGCIIGWFYKKSKPKVEDFRKIINRIKDPVLIEQILIELLPEAQKLSNNSIYVQILSQIGLFQAVQKKFDQAHQTLDEALLVCKSDDYEGQASILLARSKIFQQSGYEELATSCFDKFYELSKKYNLKI